MSIVTRTLGNRPAQPNASRETKRAVSSRVDLHVKLLDARVVARAKARGIDVLVYAPHFCDLPTIRARARRCSDAELLVVPARELFTGGWRERVHVLAIDPPAPIPDFCELDAVMAELAAQDVATLVPHPEFATVSFDAPTIDRYADQLHGLEVYNPKHRARHNRNAAALVETTGLAPFASSYAHRLATIGEVWTTFERSIGWVRRSRRGPSGRSNTAPARYIGYAASWSSAISPGRTAGRRQNAWSALEWRPRTPPARCTRGVSTPSPPIGRGPMESRPSPAQSNPGGDASSASAASSPAPSSGATSTTNAATSSSATVTTSVTTVAYSLEVVTPVGKPISHSETG